MYSYPFLEPDFFSLQICLIVAVDSLTASRTAAKSKRPDPPRPLLNGFTTGFIIINRKPLWLIDTADSPSTANGASGPGGRFGSTQSDLEGSVVTQQRLRPCLLRANDASIVCRRLAEEHASIGFQFKLAFQLHLKSF